MFDWVIENWAFNDTAKIWPECAGCPTKSFNGWGGTFENGRVLTQSQMIQNAWNKVRLSV